MLKDKTEAAQFLRIKPGTLDKLVASGLVIPCRVGGRVFFRERALLKFLNESEARARREAARLRHSAKPREAVMLARDRARSQIGS